MDFLNSTFLVAAFLAGVAALLAPCCVTVLLPSYLASVFRQRATVFLMTFVFFLGILTVFLPIGLSFGAVGKFLSSFHDPVFFLGGAFLLFLGLFLLLGFHYSLPFSVKSRSPVTGVFSIYVLGIFSALATTCCAPVLGGVLALSVLPGSIFWAGAYTLAYVLGMTLPLFLLSVALDRKVVQEKLLVLKRAVSYSWGSRRVTLAYSELLAGSVFALMGLLIIYLTATGRLWTHADYLLSINLLVAQATSWLGRNFGFLPPLFWAIVFLAIFVLVVVRALKRLR